MNGTNSNEERKDNQGNENTSTREKEMKMNSGLETLFQSKYKVVKKKKKS